MPPITRGVSTPNISVILVLITALASRLRPGLSRQAPGMPRRTRTLGAFPGPRQSRPSVSLCAGPSAAVGFPGGGGQAHAAGLLEHCGDLGGRDGADRMLIADGAPVGALPRRGF